MANRIYGDSLGHVLLEVWWDAVLTKWHANLLHTPIERVQASKANACCQSIMTRMADAGEIGTVGAEPNDYVNLPGTDGNEGAFQLLPVTFTIDTPDDTDTDTPLVASVGGGDIVVTAIRAAATYANMPAIVATMTCSTGSLTGTGRQAFAAGLASFDDLQVDVVGGAVTLTATLDNGSFSVITGAASAVVVGALASLAFTIEPANEEIAAVIVGETYGEDITVTGYDAAGNIQTASTADVVMSLTTDPPTGSTLGGTLTVALATGVAVFTDLTLDQAGAGFIMTATGGGFTDTSDPIEIF